MPYRSAILAAVEDLKDHQTGSPASSIRRRIKDHDTIFAAAIANSDDDTTWNETLFQTTLKSLVAKNILVQVNGSNYKFTDEHLKKRAETLREKAESMEEEEHRRRTVHSHVHGTVVHHGDITSGGGGTKNANYTLREEPPKDTPKKKTVHAKVKLNEGKIITVLNAEGKKKDEDEMETDDEEVKDEVFRDSPRVIRKHVKIVPRKVGAKKMISDSMSS